MSRTSVRRFWGKLKELGYSDYEGYLKSEHWADVRRRFLSKNVNRTCRGCGQPATQIHHRTYRRLGAEHLTDLVSLCRACHLDVHEAESYIPERWGLFAATKITLKRKSKGTFVRERSKALAQQARRKSHRQELAHLISDQRDDMFKTGDGLPQVGPSVRRRDPRGQTLPHPRGRKVSRQGRPVG